MTTNRLTVVHDTTWGPVTLSASTRGLTRVRFGRRADAGRAPQDRTPQRQVLEQAVAELDEYLLGRRTSFTVPVDLSGVEPPHRRVLDALCRVGYGSTLSYADLARAAGLTEDGPRRAGAACARNPVLVFVPCHRIVATNGALTGYAGGLSTKRALLALEAGQLALGSDLNHGVRPAQGVSDGSSSRPPTPQAAPRGVLVGPDVSTSGPPRPCGASTWNAGDSA